jgi:hypothetical protein
VREASRRDYRACPGRLRRGERPTVTHRADPRASRVCSGSLLGGNKTRKNRAHSLQRLPPFPSEWRSACNNSDGSPTG